MSSAPAGLAEPALAARTRGRVVSLAARNPLQLECTIVHHVPGRVRLRVRRLQHEPELGQRVVAWLTAQSGVHAARASAPNASLVVTFDSAVLSVVDIVNMLNAGLPSDAHRAAGSAPPGRSALICGGLALGLSLFGAPGLITGALLAASAVPVVARALSSLREERQLSADALDATAIGILLARGDIAAAALSASLIAGGEYIRALTARRSQGALTALLAAQGRSAWVVRGRRKERVAAELVEPGDVVVTYPGELLVVDGLVVRGRALVDQKTLTGESVPVLKTAGASVFASTVVTDGKLYVEAQAVGTRTRAGVIVQLLEDAPRHDTRLGNYARRYADRLVLPTFALAGGLLVVTGDIARAVSVLIIDFATGIRVSAPTTVLAAMTSAVHSDILVKGGRALEQLAAVDTLVFDKTGTLTEGRPRVTQVHAFDRAVSRQQVLRLAAGAEQRLSHPAAEAIVQAAQRAGVAIPERGDLHLAVGLGVRAEIEGATIHIGSPRYLARQQVKLSDAARGLADDAGRRGASTVFIARDGCLIGALSYADMPRPEAPTVIDALRARGIREFVMVTGDNTQVARYVAQQLRIERVEAEVFPEHKADIVRELQARGHVVGVIGDGINDSPALAHADVSISLKAASEVARETADIVLHGDLNGLPVAVDIARQAMDVIRQNLAIVAAPNAAGMLLAALGMVGPVGATALNNGSNVAAALNGLRPLLRRGGGAPISGPAEPVRRAGWLRPAVD
ncbi:MAG: heavy metal translocating P-type ATPase [Chloroflexi bacterium]|nr:heavy metal translocating P-type ATPase [Chloroflexota bacterium]